MAAIGLRSKLVGTLLALLSGTLPCRADRISDARARITYVASALASANPDDAITPFNKAMPGYSKLQAYFAALTDSFDISNEVEITDEDDNEREATLKANWTLHLADKTAGSDRQHTYVVSIRLKPSGKNWQIVSFSPIEMFNPQGLATFGK